MKVASLLNNIWKGHYMFNIWEGHYMLVGFYYLIVGGIGDLEYDVDMERDSLRWRYGEGLIASSIPDPSLLLV